jgi:hypothetical protein
MASHFYDFLYRRDAAKALPFSMIYEIISQRSLRLGSEDSLCYFIIEGIKTNWKMFSLLEFVRLEYCSTNVMGDFFDRLSEHFYEINASIWASLRARLVLPYGIRRQFPPSVKKGGQFDVPDGIIAYLTRKCGGNVHDHHVVAVTSGSFEKETQGANPHSGVWNNDRAWAAKNAADLEADSEFRSAYRRKEEYITPTRNNWLCYDFKERRIAPTHYALRTNHWGPGKAHLKSWLIETSADGQSWREVAREEDTSRLNGEYVSGTFAVAGGGECRFIRLVNIGRNHWGNDQLKISAWEIFGSLFE